VCLQNMILKWLFESRSTVRDSEKRYKQKGQRQRILLLQTWSFVLSTAKSMVSDNHGFPLIGNAVSLVFEAELVESFIS